MGYFMPFLFLDHILGAAALLEAEEKNREKIQVFMHATTQKEFERYCNIY